MQGEDTLGELMRQFADDPQTCLFGTLSLWQGVDVPGSACQLVVMDRIPFPRPDDPLMRARQKAVEEAGGNGFMAVAATHAALLMAQGPGRLVRAAEDRGVVAVLDSAVGDCPLRRVLPVLDARLLVHHRPQPGRAALRRRPGGLTRGAAAAVRRRGPSPSSIRRRLIRGSNLGSQRASASAASGRDADPPMKLREASRVVHFRRTHFTRSVLGQSRRSTRDDPAQDGRVVARDRLVGGVVRHQPDPAVPRA